MEIFINIFINIILSVIDIYLIEFSIINTHKFIKKRKIYILFIELILALIINMNIFHNIIFNILIYASIIYISLFNNIKLVSFKDSIPYFILIIKILTEISIFIIFEKILNTSLTLSFLNWMTSYAILSKFILRYIEYTIILIYLNIKKRVFLSIHHFKIISITISIYFSILIIINYICLFDYLFISS